MAHHRLRLPLAVLAISALVPTLAPSTASAGGRGRLTTESFFQMESISNPEIAPDGHAIVFSRGFVDLAKDQNQSNLWIVDVRGERLRQLTDGAWRDSAPTWSPDGQRIAFLSNRSGSTQVHVMWVDTRETLQLTRVDRDPRNIR